MSPYPRNFHTENHFNYIFKCLHTSSRTTFSTPIIFHQSVLWSTLGLYDVDDKIGHSYKVTWKGLVSRQSDNRSSKRLGLGIFEALIPNPITTVVFSEECTCSSLVKHLLHYHNSLLLRAPTATTTLLQLVREAALLWMFNLKDSKFPDFTIPPIFFIHSTSCLL